MGQIIKMTIFGKLLAITVMGIAVQADMSVAKTVDVSGHHQDDDLLSFQERIVGDNEFFDRNFMPEFDFSHFFRKLDIDRDEEDASVAVPLTTFSKRTNQDKQKGQTRVSYAKSLKEVPTKKLSFFDPEPAEAKEVGNKGPSSFSKKRHIGSGASPQYRHNFDHHYGGHSKPEFMIPSSFQNLGAPQVAPAKLHDQTFDIPASLSQHQPSGGLAAAAQGILADAFRIPEHIPKAEEALHSTGYHEQTYDPPSYRPHKLQSPSYEPPTFKPPSYDPASYQGPKFEAPSYGPSTQASHEPHLPSYISGPQHIQIEGHLTPAFSDFNAPFGGIRDFVSFLGSAGKGAFGDHAFGGGHGQAFKREAVLQLDEASAGAGDNSVFSPVAHRDAGGFRPATSDRQEDEPMYASRQTDIDTEDDSHESVEVFRQSYQAPKYRFSEFPTKFNVFKSQEQEDSQYRRQPSKNTKKVNFNDETAFAERFQTKQEAALKMSRRDQFPRPAAEPESQEFFRFEQELQPLTTSRQVSTQSVDYDDRGLVKDVDSDSFFDIPDPSEEVFGFGFRSLHHRFPKNLKQTDNDKAGDDTELDFPKIPSNVDGVNPQTSQSDHSPSEAERSRDSESKKLIFEKNYAELPIFTSLKEVEEPEDTVTKTSTTTTTPAPTTAPSLTSSTTTTATRAMVISATTSNRPKKSLFVEPKLERGFTPILQPSEATPLTNLPGKQASPYQTKPTASPIYYKPVKKYYKTTLKTVPATSQTVFTTKSEDVLQAPRADFSAQQSQVSLDGHQHANHAFIPAELYPPRHHLFGPKIVRNPIFLRPKKRSSLISQVSRLWSSSDANDSFRKPKRASFTQTAAVLLPYISSSALPVSG